MARCYEAKARCQPEGWRYIVQVNRATACDTRRLIVGVVWKNGFYFGGGETEVNVNGAGDFSHGF